MRGSKAENKRKGKTVKGVWDARKFINEPAYFFGAGWLTPRQRIAEAYVRRHAKHAHK